ncbi:MAG: formate/nitrite transporter family protein [Burkholderiales bacterium]
MAAPPGLDAYSPREIADRVANIGVVKARLPFLQMAMLGVLGGAFIALGALYFTLVTSDPTISYAWSRVLGGMVFSLGLIMVVVAGAELFTGNNLLVMAWADRSISTRELARNWIIVYITNVIGAFGVVALAWLAGLGELNQQRVALHVINIAVAKTAMPFWKAFFAGVLCNVLVCMAVWLAMAGRSVADKVLAIIFPISAFVAAGFEHSVANFFFIGLGLVFKADIGHTLALSLESLSFWGFARNLVPVTLGNIFGGGVLVAFVYHIIYRRKPPEPQAIGTMQDGRPRP